MGIPPIFLHWVYDNKYYVNPELYVQIKICGWERMRTVGSGWERMGTDENRWERMGTDENRWERMGTE